MPRLVDSAMREREKAELREALRIAFGNGVTLRQIADAFDASTNTVQRWASEGSPNYRPREGWRAAIADLCDGEAEERIRTAEREAAALRAHAAELRGEPTAAPKRGVAGRKSKGGSDG